MEEQIRQILPEKARQAFDDIVEQLQTEDYRNIKNRQTS